MKQNRYFNRLKMLALKAVLPLLLVLISGYASAEEMGERVYLSTDKEYYLAGENVWCSLYCLKGGKLSDLSSTAYLEFYSKEGLAVKFKVALSGGRGCGKFEIPFNLATGNYSIVAYTKSSGGDSKGEFNGKIITILNTLTNERVKDGVEICSSEQMPSGNGGLFRNSSDISVEVPKVALSGREKALFQLHNLGKDNIYLNISVYNNDDLSYMLGSKSYDKTLLLDRTGAFESVGECDYEGETIKVKVAAKTDGKAVAGKKVYMSAMGVYDDVYNAISDSLGYATFYTNNIYGNRDLVFDVYALEEQYGAVLDDAVYTVEIVEREYRHTPASIPVLKLSEDLYKSLVDRSINMQIAKRFEVDTLYEMFAYRKDPLLNDIVPVKYRLDDYTRFPLMEEVVREYVQKLRIRKLDKKESFQILWETGTETYKHTYTYSKGYTLALLDGVPVRDHALIVKMDPLLVEEIMIYPRQFAIGDFMYDGVVKFKTYKEDMGGVKMGNSVSIINYKGVGYPLALLGKKMDAERKHPNYNKTIYWNPIVALNPDESFEFECMLPDYKGDFTIVVEGMNSKGESIYYTTEFTNK